LNQKAISFLRDPSFSKGFAVHGPKHEDGIIAYLPGVETEESAVWGIAQWGCYKHPITYQTPLKTFPHDGFICENETITITANPDNSYVRLELRSTEEFCGHVRQHGEDWPHLLITQHKIHEFTPFLSNLDSLNFHCKLRLDYCEQHIKPEAFNPGLHGAQVHQFITVEDFQTGDFIWFGIPFFDNRQAKFAGYCGIDSGKSDASGALIIINPLTEFTSKTPGNGNWIAYNRDILPLIFNALELAKTKNIMLNAKPENMKVTSTNIGWEMFGDFNGAVEIKEMSIVGHLK